MNWRRGLFLAGINVAVALPMIFIQAERDAQWRQDWKQRSTAVQAHRAPVRAALSGVRATLVRVQEEQTVTFNLCDLRGRTPVQIAVVQAGNLPVQIITEWRVACPSKWSIAARFGIDDTALASEKNLKAMRRVDAALCILIAVQWFLIGSFPLFKPKRWLSEPGAFITTCNAIGTAIALIPVIEGLGRLPVVFAFFAWLWWFALLLWKPVHLAWQSTLRGRQRLSN